MEIQKENLLYGPTGQPIGKGQMYALLVDAAGAPVLDASGNQQVVAMQSTNGKLQVDASINGSLANETEQITIDGTVGGKELTAGKYGTNTRAFITVETASIRYTVDGVNPPTSTFGHLLNDGDAVELTSNSDIANFRAIRTSSTSATITITYSS